MKLFLGGGGGGTDSIELDNKFVASLDEYDKVSLFRMRCLAIKCVRTTRHYRYRHVG
jgi:hypothetical protein